MRSVLMNVIVALCVAGPAMAAPLEGVWTGSYVCAQGTTPLELFITYARGKKASALFHFGDASLARPEGCFAMSGHLDKAALSLMATHWLTRPDGYVTVNLMGPVRDQSYTGIVLGPGCSAFQLAWHPLAPTPAVCNTDPVPVS